MGGKLNEELGESATEFYSVFDMLGDMTQERFDELIDEYVENDKINFPDQEVLDEHRGTTEAGYNSCSNI